MSDTAQAGADLSECNICLEQLREPVLTLCGHLYCWACIWRWLDNGAEEHSGGACPVCQAALTLDCLVPVYGRCGSVGCGGGGSKSARAASPAPLPVVTAPATAAPPRPLALRPAVSAQLLRTARSAAQRGGGGAGGGNTVPYMRRPDAGAAGRRFGGGGGDGDRGTDDVQADGGAAFPSLFGLQFFASEDAGYAAPDRAIAAREELLSRALAGLMALVALCLLLF